MAKLKAFIIKLLNMEIIRFIIAGGINTLMGGILLPYLFRHILVEPYVYLGKFTLDMPLTIGYLIWFTFAYLIQAKFVFKAPLELKRYIAYPFSQIPNYALNQGFLYLFETVLGISALNGLVSYFLAALCPIPIMFIIVRFIVKPMKKK